MPKLTAILSNHPSPLEKALFDGQKTIEFTVDDPHDPEEVLRKLEPLVIDIRGDDRTVIVVGVFTESGAQILRGTISDGFHGTVMS